MVNELMGWDYSFGLMAYGKFATYLFDPSPIRINLYYRRRMVPFHPLTGVPMN